ncbi:MAG: hypothetical protein MK226_02230 [Saprospiraceae bacterium]|nr:hypothetical protein [Saprospiraceae bacterium]
MKIKNLKQIAVVAAFLLTAASFTSCNRGYGCPSNFSVEQSGVQLVKTAVKAVLK